MRHCSNHCSGCGSHFTSLGAFDTHRSGSHEEGRVCWDPDNEQLGKLRVVTEEGECHMTADGLAPVRIWEHGVRSDRARTRFRSYATPQAEAAVGQGVAE